jgi:hypothetical protein
MKLRTRNYVMLLVAAIAGFVYARISRDWSGVAFYGGLAGVVVLVGAVGLPWLEFAPDGAFRRRPKPD